MLKSKSNQSKNHWNFNDNGEALNFNSGTISYTECRTTKQIETNKQKKNKNRKKWKRKPKTLPNVKNNAPIFENQTENDDPL